MLIVFHSLLQKLRGIGSQMGNPAKTLELESNWNFLKYFIWIYNTSKRLSSLPPLVDSMMTILLSVKLIVYAINKYRC